jgi:hypothetical protein
MNHNEIKLNSYIKYVPSINPNVILKWVFDKEWVVIFQQLKNFTEFVTEKIIKVVTHIYKYHFNSSAIFFNLFFTYLSKMRLFYPGS